MNKNGAGKRWEEFEPVVCQFPIVGTATVESTGQIMTVVGDMDKRPRIAICGRLLQRINDHPQANAALAFLLHVCETRGPADVILSQEVKT